MHLHTYGYRYRYGMMGVFLTNKFRLVNKWLRKLTTPTGLSASQKLWRLQNDDNGGDATLRTNRAFKGWFHRKRRRTHLPHEQMGDPWKMDNFRLTEWRSRWVLRGLAWSSRILIYGNILRFAHKNPTTHPYLPRMERHPKISETLMLDLPYKEKSPLLRDLDSLLTTI